jgi:tetratricopeptide (TPR) repeat protein
LNHAENLKQAIACYQAALRVRTEADFPQAWATTQNNLGNAYQDLSTGDRGENLKQTIACYEAALRVRTEADFPQAWAMTQNNLARVHVGLFEISGERDHLARSRDRAAGASRGFGACGLTNDRDRMLELVAMLDKQLGT